MKWYSYAFHDVFQNDISILVDIFQLPSKKQLNSLSTKVLQLIMCSDQFKISDDNYLFNFLLKLIEDNQYKKSLLKNVKFHSISSQLLEKFLRIINADDFEFGLFDLSEHMKTDKNRNVTP